MKVRRIHSQQIPGEETIRTWLSSGDLLSDADHGAILFAAFSADGSICAVMSISSEDTIMSFIASPDMQQAMPQLIAGIESKIHAKTSAPASTNSIQAGNHIVDVHPMNATGGFVPERAGVQHMYYPRMEASMEAINEAYQQQSTAMRRNAATPNDADAVGYVSYADMANRRHPDGQEHMMRTTPDVMAGIANGSSDKRDGGKNNKRQRGALRIAVAIIAVAAALAVAVGVFVATSSINISGLLSLSEQPDSSTEEEPYRIDESGTADLTVEPGEGTFDVSNNLRLLGFPGAADQLADNIASIGSDAVIQPGTYTLHGSETPMEIAQRLVDGKHYPYGTIGINDGDEIKTIAKAIDADGTLPFNGQAFVDACSNVSIYKPNYTMLDAVPDGVSTVEGFIPPGIFGLRDCINAEDAVRMMLDAGQRRFEATGLSPQEYYDDITVASMIEKEAGFDEDRPLIASVIYNRLDAGMTLSIDATVKYALGSDEARVTYADTEVDSPYNTYINRGLPIGPICCGVSDASLDAALHPAQTDYLYYVLADKEGHHAFSSTPEQFEQDRQRYLELFGYTDDVTADQQQTDGQQ